MDGAISFRSLGKQMILKQLAKNNFCIILLCSVSLMTNQIIELNHIIFDWFGFFFLIRRTKPSGPVMAPVNFVERCQKQFLNIFLLFLFSLG
jgi:hypothetical protein